MPKNTRSAPAPGDSDTGDTAPAVTTQSSNVQTVVTTPSRHTEDDPLIPPMTRSEFTAYLSSAIQTAVDKATTGLRQKIKSDIESEFATFKSEITNKLKECNSRISDLDNKYKVLQSSYDDLVSKINNAIEITNENEQYGRRWLLRLHGIATAENENCIDTCLKIFNGKILKDSNETIQRADIEAAHRLGKRPDGKPPGIIVRFQQCSAAGQKTVDTVTAASTKRKRDSYN